MLAGEQEAQTAQLPDISLSFIKTLHSFITTHSLRCKIFLVYIFFFYHLSLSSADLFSPLLFQFLFLSHLHFMLPLLIFLSTSFFLVFTSQTFSYRFSSRFNISGLDTTFLLAMEVVFFHTCKHTHTFPEQAGWR